MDGARDAGFNLVVGYDNKPWAGTQETYDNWEAATEAAIARIKEVVNLD